MNNVPAKSIILRVSSLILLLAPVSRTTFAAESGQPYRIDWIRIPGTSDGFNLDGFNLTVVGKVIAPVRFSSNVLLRGAYRCHEQPVARRETHRSAGESGHRSETLGTRLPEWPRTPQSRRFSRSLFLVDYRSVRPKAMGSSRGSRSLSLPCRLDAGGRGRPSAGMAQRHSQGRSVSISSATSTQGSPEICSNWSRNWSYVVPIGCLSAARGRAVVARQQALCRLRFHGIAAGRAIRGATWLPPIAGGKEPIDSSSRWPTPMPAAGSRR